VESHRLLSERHPLKGGLDVPVSVRACRSIEALAGVEKVLLHVSD
jgi:hypothetical protein